MRIFTIVLTCGAWVAAAAGMAAPPASARLNVLLLVADDLATRLECYGDRLAVTPHLDRLAATGVVFDRAFCQGAVCTPSRTSFMLGLDNAHANPDHFRKHPDTMTLGRWFREHGYQTFSVGKIDHTDDYVDPQAWEKRVAMHDLGPRPGLARVKFGEDLPPRDGAKLARDYTFIGVAEADGQVHDGVVADRAIGFLDGERDPNRPFFAAIGFHTPHVPWDATTAEFKAHDPERFPLSRTPDDVTPLPPKSLRYEPGLSLSEERQRESIRGYYAAVTFLDRQIGRVLDAVEEHGLADETIVVFMSDHGYHLGWRGQWCKHSLSEQVMRVPLVVRLPGGALGARADGIVELVDLFPSLCDAAGLPMPSGLDGESFVPLLRNPAGPGKAAAYCRWGNGRTVRTTRWRYTERLDGSAELYDHDADAEEFHDVDGMPAHAAVVRELATLLEKRFGPRGTHRARRAP